MLKEEVLITGCGSLGKALLLRLLRDFKCKGIRIYSRSELRQFELRSEIEKMGLVGMTPVSWLIGDIRDKERLDLATQGVDVIINTAAMKRIEICDSDPLECIKTNIDGVRNIIEVSLKNNVKKVLQISTDKAVYPTTLYGSSKKCAEDLMRTSNVYNGVTKFSCIRYGNVLGSNGSVIQIWNKQKDSDFINITDPKMTRFWISQKEVVKFIINRLQHMSGDEIFIPKMKHMGLLDMAYTLYPGESIKYIGMKKDEKLHECLLTLEESRYTEIFTDFYRIDSFKNNDHLDDWSVTSNDKTDILSRSELTTMLKEI